MSNSEQVQDGRSLFLCREGADVSYTTARANVVQDFCFCCCASFSSAGSWVKQAIHGVEFGQ